jgi:hypothetical protein
LAAARAEIDHHTRMAFDQLVDLTDVHLEDTPSDYLSHRRIITSLGGRAAYGVPDLGTVRVKHSTPNSDQGLRPGSVGSAPRHRYG